MFSTAEVGAMRDCVWRELLEPAGLRRDDPSSWRAGGPLALREVGGALHPGPGCYSALAEIGQAPAFAAVEPVLTAVLGEATASARWAPVPGSGGGLAAPNFPIGGSRWTVPHAAWHADEPTTARPGAWALLAFVLLDAVEPGGGATVAVAGSARRLQKLAAGDPDCEVLATDQSIAALAETEDWVAKLVSAGGDPAARIARFMRDGCVSAGVPMRVVELTGAAGDVVLMDPRCLHTVSANTGAGPRLMMRVTCARVP